MYHSRIIKENCLELGTAKARPGQKSWGQFLIRQGRKKVSLPVCIINGRWEGSHVVMVANQHGREVAGFEAIRSFCENLDPRKLRGSILAIPSMNPVAAQLGLNAWTEGEPLEDAAMSYGTHSKNERPVWQDFAYCTKYNMNWNWPGKKGGTLVQRVIHEVLHRVILEAPRKPQMVIDIHCHAFPSAIYAQGTQDHDLACLSGLRYVYLQGGVGESSFENYCLKEGIPHFVTAELQQAGVILKESVADGVRMLGNFLKYLGMLKGKLELPQEVIVIDPWGFCAKVKNPHSASLDIRAQQDGLLVIHQDALALVRKGELICELCDPHTGKAVQSVRAPKPGYLGNLHVETSAIKKGERLCRIDRVAKKVHPSKLTDLPSKSASSPGSKKRKP